jgi:hypothetical protein
MVRDVLARVAGIGVFPTVSLVLFVVVFALAVVHAMRLGADGARRMAALPLDPPDNKEHSR